MPAALTYNLCNDKYSCLISAATRPVLFALVSVILLQTTVFPAVYTNYIKVETTMQFTHVTLLQENFKKIIF